MSEPQIIAQQRRKELSKKRNEVLYALRRKHGDNCAVCKKYLEVAEMTIDHIRSLKNGGNNTTKNLQILCFHCNQTKGSKKIHPSNILGIDKIKEIFSNGQLNG
jgi:5-methylcytosine-specific restriction endonuclease McrA